MKKLISSIGLAFSLAGSGFCGDIDLTMLNSRVTDVLSPYQNQNTVIKGEFARLNMDAIRVYQADFSGLYQKTGSVNTLKLQINHLRYDYGTGQEPKLTFKGALDFDLSRVVSADQINSTAPHLVYDIIHELSKKALELEDALTLRGLNTSLQRDADGNIESLGAFISARIDLDQLSTEMRRDIPATEGALSFTLNVHKGMTIDGYVIMNPEYMYFQHGETGLKEQLEQFIAGDEQLLMKMNMGLMYLDYMVGMLVEQSELMASWPLTGFKPH